MDELRPGANLRAADKPHHKVRLFLSHLQLWREDARRSTGDAGLTGGRERKKERKRPEPGAYRRLGVAPGGQGPLRTHLRYQQTATAQGPPHGAQGPHHPRPRHHMGIHYMRPGRDLVQAASVLPLDRVPDVGELAVFEDEEAVLFRQRL